MNDEQRIRSLECAVTELGRYVYELASIAEQSGYALSELRRRPPVVVNVLVVVVDGADPSTWRVVTDALASGESSL